MEELELVDDVETRRPGISSVVGIRDEMRKLTGQVQNLRAEIEQKERDRKSFEESILKYLGRIIYILESGDRKSNDILESHVVVESSKRAIFDDFNLGEGALKIGKQTDYEGKSKLNEVEGLKEECVGNLNEGQGAKRKHCEDVRKVLSSVIDLDSPLEKVAFEIEKSKNDTRNAKETKKIRVEDSIDGVCDSYDSKSSNSSLNTGFHSSKQEEMINISGEGLRNEKKCRSDQEYKISHTISKQVAGTVSIPNSEYVKTPSMKPPNRPRIIPPSSSINNMSANARSFMKFNLGGHEKLTSPGQKEEYSMIGGSIENFEYIRKEDSSTTLTSTKNYSSKKANTLYYIIGAYILTKPLTNYDYVSVVEYIFDEKEDKCETIVQSDCNHLTRAQMLSLGPDSWLEGDVINVVSEFMTNKHRSNTIEPSVWFLPTRMTTESMTVGRIVENFLMTHNIQKTFMGSLQHCKKIFIPINNNYHWILFVVRVEDQVVEIWDSLLKEDSTSSGCNLVRDVLQNLDTALKLEILKCKSANWSFTQFDILTITSLPQQPNNVDCGIFCLNFMEDRKTNALKFPLYNTHDERARIALKIILSKYNYNRSFLFKKASAYMIRKENLKKTLMDDL